MKYRLYPAYIIIIFFFFLNNQAYSYIGLTPIISLLTGLGWVFSTFIVLILGVIIYPIYIFKKKKDDSRKEKNKKD